MNTCIQTFWIPERNYSFERGYELIKKAGFDGVDLSLDNTWSKEEIKKGIKSRCIFAEGVDAALKAYDEELNAIRKNGLKICQAHAPFPDYASGYPEIEPYAHGVLVNCIRFCDKLGIPLLVIHGATQLINDPAETFEKNREINMRIYRSLIPEIKKTNVRICLENLFGRYGKSITQGFCANPYEAIDYVDTLNKEAGKECFAFCFDTGHLNLVGGNQANFIKLLGNRIQALHIHDNRGFDDDHLMPYAGTILWENVLDGLREIKYDGPVNFEIIKQMTVPGMPDVVADTFVETIGKIAGYFVKRVSEQ